MKTYFATAALLIAGLAALSTANTAQARAELPLIADIVYNFSGECTDCSGNGLAHLSLFHYVAGNPLSIGSFVRFDYDGSDLFPGGFSIFRDSSFGNPGVDSLTGTVPALLPAAFDFSISDGIHFFITGSDGTWSTGTASVTADFGINSSWTVGLPSNAIAAVPEPATIALLGMGLAGLGFARRRRNR